MAGLLKLASAGAFLIVGTLAVIVAAQLLTGRISTRHLLQQRDERGRLSFSAGRAQMLIVTLFGALYYLALICTSPSHNAFPPLPKALLEGIGSSQAIYLALKARALLFRS